MMQKTIFLLRRNELTIAKIIFLLLLMSFSYTLRFNWIRSFGDSSFLSELIENIAATGHASSHILSSSHEMEVKAHIYAMKADQILSTSLKATDYQNEYVLKYHTYFILYLIAPFSLIVPVNVLLSFLTSLSFLGMLYVAYLFLRKKGVTVFGSLIFCILITLHPAWNYAIQGEFYVDRFFMLLGFLYFILISSRNPNYLAISVIGILCLITNDRIGLFTGAFAIGYSVLYFKKSQKKYSLFLFLFGIFSVGYAIFAMKVLLSKVGAGGTYDSWLTFSVITRFLDYLKNYTNAFDNFLLFCFVNVLILTVFGIFDWKAMLIALGSMVPNILGNIGGAEKTGWSTHYHSNYFPILVWALATGYVRIFEQKKMKLVVRTFAFFIVIGFSLFYLFFNPFSLKDKSFVLSSLDSNAFVVAYRAVKSGNEHPSAQLYETAEEIREYIPEGSKVSTINIATSFIYKNRFVYYYPLALDEADYVVLTYEKLPTGQLYYNIWVNYDPIENVKMNQYLNERLKNVGYDTQNPKLFNANFAVLKRIKSPKDQI